MATVGCPPGVTGFWVGSSPASNRASWSHGRGINSDAGGTLRVPGCQVPSQCLRGNDKDHKMIVDLLPGWDMHTYRIQQYTRALLHRAERHAYMHTHTSMHSCLPACFHTSWALPRVVIHWHALAPAGTSPRRRRSIVTAIQPAGKTVQSTQSLTSTTDSPPRGSANVCRERARHLRASCAIPSD